MEVHPEQSHNNIFQSISTQPPLSKVQDTLNQRIICR